MNEFKSALPCNPDAERQILGMMLQHEASPIIATAIKLLKDGEMFYHQKTRDVYLAIKGLFEDELPVEPVSVVDRLEQNGSKYNINEADILGIFDGIPFASPESMEYYVNIIQAHYQRRKAIMLGKHLANYADNMSEDILKVLDDSLSQLQDIRNAGQNGDLSIKEQLSGIFKDLNNQDSSLNGLETGFRDLDRLIYCFGNGDLIVISGPTNIGKSTFCQNIGQYMAFEQQQHIVYISTELTVENMILRLLSSESGMTYMDLRRKHIPESKWPLLTMAASKIAKENFIIFDHLQTLDDIEATCKWYKLLGKCDCIFIDHIGHIGTTQKTNNDTEELGKVAKKAKGMAIRLKVPVVCIHHMNKYVDQRQSKIPVLGDLKGSSSLPQDSDMVMFLHHDQYYDDEIPDITDPEIEIYIRKVRNGRRGKINLFFNSKEERYRNLQHKTF